MKLAKGPARLIATSLVVAMTVSSCSIVNPYVRVDDSKLKSGVTLQQAVTYAIDTRDEYYCAISEHTLFNRTIGIVVVGAAAAALAIGVTGGSTDVITGLGTGGAGLFGMHQVLYSANRPKIYVEGAKAIGCTLAAFVGVRAADTSKLEPALDTLAAQVMDLSSDLQKFPPGFSDVEGQVPRARKVLEVGRTTLARGREANALIRSAGVRLYDAVEGIRAQVNTALLSNEPDVAQLVSGLSKTIPAYAQSITGSEFAVPPTQGTGHADLRDDVRQVMQKANRVETTSREVESIIASIGTAPTAAQVEACGINATDAGLNFRVDPTTVVVDTSAADPTADVIASGGKAPYHAQWAGEVPGSDVTLHPVDHDRGSRNQGVITITATQSAAAGNYKLLVTDEGNGRGTVLVTIRSTGGQRGGTAAGTASGMTGDSVVVEVQKKLIELGCLASTREDGKTNADGELGAVTEAALKKLWLASGEQEGDFELTLKVGGHLDRKAIQEFIKNPGARCDGAVPPPTPQPTPGP